MKMTWLHTFFGLFLIPADGRAKLAQQLILTVLPFHPLYFPWHHWRISPENLALLWELALKLRQTTPRAWYDSQLPIAGVARGAHDKRTQLANYEDLPQCFIRSRLRPLWGLHSFIFFSFGGVVCGWFIACQDSKHLLECRDGGTWAGGGWGGGGARPPPVLSDNPILTWWRGSDTAHFVTTPPPPTFSDLLTSLLWGHSTATFLPSFFYLLPTFEITTFFLIQSPI